MSVENKDSRAVASGVKAFIADFVFNEMQDRIRFDALTQSAIGTTKNSVERKDFDAFVDLRAKRLGYASVETRKAHYFSASSDGFIKLMMGPAEARRVVEALETGRSPLREPSKTASWLASWPAIKNPGDVAAIAAFNKDKTRGGFVLVAKEDVAKLPAQIRPRMSQGGLDLTKDGFAKIFVSVDTARDAISLQEGKALTGSLSATSTLIWKNPDIVSYMSYISRKGDRVSPVEVLKGIAENKHRTASAIYISPTKLIEAVDRQMVPKALEKVLKAALGESIDRSVANAVIISRAWSKTQETQKVVAPRMRESVGMGA